MSDAINDTLDALSKRIPDPVTRRQLAGILDMAMQSFANWDCQGRGIGGSVKIAGRVFYRRSDVVAPSSQRFGAQIHQLRKNI